MIRIITSMTDSENTSLTGVIKELVTISTTSEQIFVATVTLIPAGGQAEGTQRGDKRTVVLGGRLWTCLPLYSRPTVPSE